LSVHLTMNYLHNEMKLQSNKKISTKALVMTGMFTALICVMAQISIPTQPIPFTLAVFAILLTGALLPTRYAFLSVLTYLLLGAFGVPVFAGFMGGLGRLMGPTGGYLMAYPIMSFITALFYQWFKKYKVLALVAGMVVSLLLCYLIGTLWFSLISGNDFYKSLTLCVFPFVLFDTLKIVLATSVSIVIRKTVMNKIEF
jgi:biotin transport system substrate-specific component